MPNHPKTVTIDAWKGLNNVLSPDRTPQDYLKTAENVDIDKSGGIKKRKGYQLVSSGDYHSLWSDQNNCFVVKNNVLNRVGSDMSFTALQSNISDSLISFESIEGEGEVYFVSNEHTGIIQNNTVKSFGIQAPNPLPSMSVSSGILDKGTYSVTLTYVTTGGQESGAMLPQTISIPVNGAINLSGIPVSSNPRINRVRIYCSTANGEIQYLVAEISNGTTSYKITDVTKGITPLKSFNVYPAPNGHIVKYAHGRLYIAQDNVVWYSEPYAYEWWKPHTNFFQFEDRVRAIMPTEGGLWIAADRLYYLSGRDPNSMNRKMVEPVKVVERSDVRIVGSYIFIENTPIGYKWLVTTDKGIFVCFNDGIALNMSERNVSFPEADLGSAVFIQDEGINKYVTLLQKKRDNDNIAVGDQATATIIRNGVVVPS